MNLIAYRFPAPPVPFDNRPTQLSVPEGLRLVDVFADGGSLIAVFRAVTFADSEEDEYGGPTVPYTMDA